MRKSKFLYVLRHGEAEHGIGYLGDINRALTNNGIKKLQRLFLLIKEKEITFDLAIVSTANRTRQTAEIVLGNFPPERILLEERIYEADASDILVMLEEIDTQVEHLLLVGHNPAVSALVSHLCGMGYFNMLPGMMAVLELQVDDWSLIGESTAILKEVLE